MFFSLRPGRLLNFIIKGAASSLNHDESRLLKYLKGFCVFSAKNEGKLEFSAKCSEILMS
jgi:hypothetical protein